MDETRFIVADSMGCVECFTRDGDPSRAARFVVNGQSLCQTHVHVAVRELGEGPKTYAWPKDGGDSEPSLKPESSSRDTVVSEVLDEVRRQLNSRAAGLETAAMNLAYEGKPSSMASARAAELRHAITVVDGVDPRFHPGR